MYVYVYACDGVRVMMRVCELVIASIKVVCLTSCVCVGLPACAGCTWVSATCVHVSPSMFVFVAQSGEEEEVDRVLLVEENRSACA